MKKSIITPILITIGSFFSLAMIIMLFSYHYDKYSEYQKEHIEIKKDSMFNYPLKKTDVLYPDLNRVPFNRSTDRLVDSLITTPAEISFEEYEDVFDIKHINLKIEYDDYHLQINYTFGEKFKRAEKWEFLLVDINGRETPLNDLIFYESYKVSKRTLKRLKSICKICKME